MSVTGHNDVRRADDFYTTPAWCTKALLRQIDRDFLHVFDPCAGNGAILDVIRDEGCPTRGIELHAGRAATAFGCGHAVVQRDALTDARWDVEWDTGIVIANPPFSLAMEFVQRAIAECRRVAMLLRLPWLASQKRAYWLRKNTPSVCVLPKRPSFTGTGKTDATDYGWMLWGFEPPSVHILEVPE